MAANKDEIIGDTIVAIRQLADMASQFFVDQITELEAAAVLVDVKQGLEDLIGDMGFGP